MHNLFGCHVNVVTSHNFMNRTRKVHYLKYLRFNLIVHSRYIYFYVAASVVHDHVLHHHGAMLCISHGEHLVPVLFLFCTFALYFPLIFDWFWATMLSARSGEI